jgi:hypothetical protein
MRAGRTVKNNMAQGSQGPVNKGYRVSKAATAFGPVLAADVHPIAAAFPAMPAGGLNGLPAACQRQPARSCIAVGNYIT